MKGTVDIYYNSNSNVRGKLVAADAILGGKLRSLERSFSVFSNVCSLLKFYSLKIQLFPSLLLHYSDFL